MSEASERFKYWHYRQDISEIEEEKKEVVQEHSLDLVVNGVKWLSLICSPTHLEALGIGFLYTENIIRSLDEIKSYCLTDDKKIFNVELYNIIGRPSSFHRTSTSLTMDSKNIRVLPAEDERALKATEIIRLYREFNQLQELHSKVGGFHSASLCDVDENKIVVEDLGRHNCVDKLAGLYLLNKEDFSIHAMLLSGRISSEMVAKALSLQAPVVISRTSPTALAIHTAERAGMTLIGYLRGEQFDIYSHPERLVI